MERIIEFCIKNNNNNEEKKGNQTSVLEDDFDFTKIRRSEGSLRGGWFEGAAESDVGKI